MRRITAVAITLTGLVMGCSGFAGDAAPYCPPGAKYCPVPASTGVQPDAGFGLPAPAPQTLAYGGQRQLTPADVRLNPGEQLIMIAPNGGSGYQNQPVVAMQQPHAAPARYGNPPPPQRPLYATAQANGWQAAAAPAGHRPSQAEQVYYGQKRVRESHSEVANQTLRRDKKEITANNDDRVPWYKGGMWRNRKGRDDGKSGASGSSARGRNDDYDAYDDDYDDDPVAARRSGSSATAGRQSPRLMDDGPGLWDDDDDDDYSGYNPDGTFGRQGGGSQAARPPAGISDPFGDMNNGYGAGPNIYANDPSGLAGPVMTAGSTSGNYCPPETYPDPYATGRMSEYGPFDTSNYGGTDVYHPSPVTSNSDYGTGNFVSPVYSDPYATTTYSDPYATYGGASYPAPAPATSYPPSGYESYTGGGFANSGGYQAGPMMGQSAPYYDNTPVQPSAYQPPVSTSSSSSRSPQFDNAVRMVKDNRFSEAKAILAAETSRNPGNAAAWRWLADCHYNLLELDDAIICYQQSLERDPNDYFALRGQGFSYLHRGHEYWRRMQEEVGRGEKDEAASTFALAHDDYKKSLEMLGLCLRRNPTDGEAIFGEAMAAEGASRKLYSNALSYLKLGPGQRERAELFAENCMTVIDKGIERSMERAKLNPGDAGPRALMGGLYLRKATLYHQLDKNDLALMELRRARDVQQSILDEIDKNNPTAKRSIQECEALWGDWGGNRN